MHVDIEIGRAGMDDLDGIRLLQQINHADNGGRLSACRSREQIMAAMGELPQIVARRGDQVVGFLLTTLRKAGGSVPILEAMLKAYPGAVDAYIYGPICVDEALRGQGVAQAMFDELRRQLPGREGLLFVRGDNPASLRAHQKMDMREVACFMFNGVEHVVLAYRG
ncbi:GNAT family N-acetyltransferase [Uliginosibacterium gangwonense]|uniref:GNAT family N-acetyltransferase n=1 Tax=Uliginosibacterium gangwonense TaxID=392736 RepID=UPI0012FA3219|nr:GNAT family N-acetyltransferase [Uliginosibacterium gangwonense]